MYPASGLLFCDGSGVKKPLRTNNREAVFFCCFSGIGIHLFKISLKCISPVGEKGKAVCDKL